MTAIDTLRMVVAEFLLDGPLSVIDGNRVTHLRYAVRYG